MGVELARGAFLFSHPHPSPGSTLLLRPTDLGLTIPNLIFIFGHVALCAAFARACLGISLALLSPLHTQQSSSDVSSPASSSRTPGATPSPPSRPSPTSSTYGALPVISSGSSSGSRSIPLTPPPSPPFNVQSAAAKLRAMDGYVSFANVEGLGLPPGMDGDEEGEGEEGGSRSGIRGWWKAAFSARSRSGSASAGAGAMPSRRDA